MKVYLDDMRTPAINAGDWNIVRTYEACIALLQTGLVKELSLDHDLGTTKTGYDVALWLEREVWVNGFTPPLVLSVHSANSVGQKNIRSAFDSICRGHQMNLSGRL